MLPSPICSNSTHPLLFHHNHRCDLQQALVVLSHVNTNRISVTAARVPRSLDRGQAARTAQQGSHLRIHTYNIPLTPDVNQVKCNSDSL